MDASEPNLTLTLTLPAWLNHEIDWTARLTSDQEQMSLVIQVAGLNVINGGGPFAAAVFNNTGQLLSLGVNQVLSENCSIAHAEIMALIFAERRLQRYRLQEPGQAYSLVSSSQPCAMCFGAILWAGLDRLLYGSDQEQVQNLAGFDEGPLPPQWEAELHNRGIQVIGGLLQEKACQVLRKYREGNGVVY